MSDLSIELNDLERIGSGLARPECVLTTLSGDLFVSDKRGGVSVIRRNGETEFIEAKNRPAGFLPNGIALMPDRSFLIADLGPGAGVWHMAQDGTMTPRLMEIEGRTPLVGLLLFVVAGIGKIPLAGVIRAIVPFLAWSIVVLALVTIFPVLATWLPSLS